MSTTSIYRLGRDPGEIGETRNAWLGAMYVWNFVARQYCGLENFPFSNDAQARKVWNAHTNPKMLEHERIVLMSTMDNATVDGADASRLVEAMRKFGSEHPNSSFNEQADIIAGADLKPGDKIAWLQTSVSEFWGAAWEDDEDDDINGGRTVWYDPQTQNDHFDVFEELGL
jgi:hypothetical protein